MPWSAKAQELLRDQYAAVGAAARAALAAGGRRAGARRQRATARESRALLADAIRAARRDWSRGSSTPTGSYCWPVESLADLKLAPFHLLATEGAVHTDKDHVWHMETLADVCRADPELLLATPYQRRGRDRPGERGRRRSPGGRS